MLGSGWMPFTTELAAVKLGFSSEVVKLNSLFSRWVSATSPGELSRVGTRPEGGFCESPGKTL